MRARMHPHRRKQSFPSLNYLLYMILTLQSSIVSKKPLNKISAKLKDFCEFYLLAVME